MATTAENKILRKSGGNCWDHAHVAIRIAKALNIPLKRKSKGVHVFVAYRLPEIKNTDVYFAFDPLYCRNPGVCPHQFLNKKLNTIKSTKDNFLNREMKEEKCFVNTMKNDPSRFLFFK